MKQLLFYDDLSMKVITPPKDTLHIWTLDMQTRPHSFLDLITEEDKQLSRQYIDVRDQERFLRRRATLRSLLSQYLKTPSGDIQFESEKNGKPFIPGLPLQFSLSHTSDWVCIAIDAQDRVGVDIEVIRPFDEMDEIIRDFFSEEEKKYVQQKEKERRFWEIWNRKEASLKARGYGLTDDLQIWDSLAQRNSLGWSFIEDLDVWVFSKSIPTRYSLAVAYKRQSNE